MEKQKIQSNINKLLQNKNVLRIFDALHSFKGEKHPKPAAKLVGGCVRDALSDRKISDIDFATNLTPNNIIKALKQNNITAIPTGIKHGTITAVLEKQPFEITTLRKDVECFGRDANVVFTDDWEQDAARRDFTINALYLNQHGDIFDYFFGLNDLKNKTVKFIGNPQERIQEDYLRILRYYRFISYYGANPSSLDITSLQAIKQYREKLATISGERIQLELQKILSATFAKQALQMLDANQILPHIGLKKLHSDINQLVFCNDFGVNLALLAKYCGLSKEELDNFTSRLKLSNHIIRTTYRLFSDHTFALNSYDTLAHKSYIFRHGYSSYSQMILYQNCLGQNIQAIYWEAPKFPVDGFDLQKLNLHGQELGNAKKKLEEIWIESDFRLDKEELLSKILTAQKNKK